MDIKKYQRDIKELGEELDVFLSQPWNILQLILTEDYKSELINFYFSMLNEPNDNEASIVLNIERIIKEELCRISADKINQILQSMPVYLGQKSKRDMYQYAITNNSYVWMHVPKYYRRPKMYNAALTQAKKALSLIPEEILKSAI